MPRPTVLVATTDPVMAYALRARLKKPCRKLGLRLDVCPDGTNRLSTNARGAAEDATPAYASAEELFDYLDSRPPMELADTLVVLDVGASLGEAFAPEATAGEQGWHVTENRAGVAIELILRFPQVFPVILSPAVHCDEAEYTNEPDKVEVIEPTTRGIEEDEWEQFRSMWNDLCVKHRQKVNGVVKEVCEPLCKDDVLLAYRVPLHFVSPLDGGRGLISILARFARGMRCWFDPTGLRTLIRNYFLGTVFGNKENGWENTKGEREALQKRLGSVAVAIDEEREFAMLNAYAAYKFGRRAWIVTTFAEFDESPLWAALDGQNNPEDVVVIRDIDLRFPDIPDNDPAKPKRDRKASLRESLKSVRGGVWRLKRDGKDRDRLLPEWRVRVVSSHPDVVGSRKARSWCSELKRLGESCGSGGEKGSIKYLGLPKPVDSIYTLRDLLCGEPPTEQDGVSMHAQLHSVSDESKGGHGAPYSNLAMSEFLLQQARRCKDGPMENLLGALLAGEAYELLLGMSKTTALEALLIQHKKEVSAEVEFPGVSHDIRIDKRRYDIEETLHTLCSVEVDKASGEESSKTQGRLIREVDSKAVEDMFLSQFWAEMRVIYREGEHFSAAEEANKESLVNLKWRFVPDSWVWWRGVKKSARILWMALLWVLQILKPLAPILVWVKKKLRIPQIGRLWFKRRLLRPAISIPAWITAFFANVIIFTTAYACAWGRDFQLEGFPTYAKILAQVAIGSFSFQLPGNGELVHPKQYDILQLFVMFLHAGFSYILFGLLISMIYRKITRS